MSMIKVENLTFSYPSSYDPIFENVSFQIDTDWKRQRKDDVFKSFDGSV